MFSSQPSRHWAQSPVLKYKEGLSFAILRGLDDQCPSHCVQATNAMTADGKTAKSAPSLKPSMSLEEASLLESPHFIYQ